MGQSVGADLPTLELLEDPAAVDPQAGVDEDVADQVDVGGIGREARAARGRRRVASRGPA